MIVMENQSSHGIGYLFEPLEPVCLAVGAAITIRSDDNVSGLGYCGRLRGFGKVTGTLSVNEVQFLRFRDLYGMASRI